MVTKCVLWMVKVPASSVAIQLALRRIPVFVLVLYRKPLHELMIDSDKILVMGHQREDYDALGGIIGVAAIARALGKELRIVLSKRNERHR